MNNPNQSNSQLPHLQFSGHPQFNPQMVAAALASHPQYAQFQQFTAGMHPGSHMPSIPMSSTPSFMDHNAMRRPPVPKKQRSIAHNFPQSVDYSRAPNSKSGRKQSVLLSNDIISLAEINSFPVGDFDEVRKTFRTSDRLLSAGNRAIPAIDRFDFRNFKSMYPQFLSYHPELQDFPEVKHTYEISEQFVPRTAADSSSHQLYLPIITIAPLRTAFQSHISGNGTLTICKNFSEMTDKEYHLLLTNRLAQNPIYLRKQHSSSSRGKRKFKSTSTEISSPTSQKESSKRSKISAPSPSSEGLKILKKISEKGSEKSHSKQKLAPQAGFSFDEIPERTNGLLRRRQEKAAHQCIYTFREISEGDLGSSQNYPSEDEKMKPIQNLAIPVHFDSQIFFVPRDMSSISADVSIDGFDDIPSHFVNPSWDNRGELFQIAKKRRSSIPFVSHDESFLQLQEESGNIEELVRKTLGNILKKEAIKESKRFQSRIFNTIGQCKKISILVSKECKRHCQRFSKAGKESNLRAKKLVREMQNYWRRSEKDLSEKRKQREKEIIEQRRKEEERREEMRQQRKLEFLLTQTELFSHFIGKKLGILPDAAANSTLLNNENNLLSHTEINEVKQEALHSAKEYIIRQQELNRNEDAAYRALSKGLDLPQGVIEVSETSQEPTILDDVDLLNPSTMPTTDLVSEPSIFKGKLKSYQIKGLNWLVNLYAQGINGILADEMGLGKTIQTICFLAYLADIENIWGPFLIVCPNSTLLQWINEIGRFCPDLKVIPYWGSQDGRKVLRKFWKPKEIYTREGYFHVCVTSYAVFVQDEKFFRRLNWQYLILDEAQAIKNASSLRWKSLLGIKSRNRLLLSGTPIQNSMAELWALLHFIMPTWFDSFEEFNEWFSKDIESHATGDKSSLDAHQLSRLHMILKPFMLRRVKSDVENEMAPKIEVQVDCPLSKRQKVMYDALRQKLSFANLDDPTLTSEENMMNPVMQFRKVCNHPDLFDLRFPQSPVSFLDLNSFPDLSMKPLVGRKKYSEFEYVSRNGRSPINIFYPRLLYHSFDEENLNYFRRELLFSSKLNFWHSDLMGNSQEFSFVKLMGLSFSEASFLFWAQNSFIHLFLFHSRWSEINGFIKCFQVFQSEPDAIIYERFSLNRSLQCYVPSAITFSPEMVISSYRFTRNNQSSRRDRWEKEILLGKSLCFSSELDWSLRPLRTSLIEPSLLHVDDFSVSSLLPHSFYQLSKNSSFINMPSFERMVSDSGKMVELEKLLAKLKQDGHRVLIFSQMRKMLDILEEFMKHHKYKMYRLDGMTNVFERHAMVSDFQQNDDTFVFLLSTRAGGLGITLTAADTVVFFDSDWNPTMDAQAMDRVHRIGQTKQVHVYRLVCKDTIEEKILRRAQEKYKIQKTVYAGGFKLQAQEAEGLKADELRELLMAE